MTGDIQVEERWRQPIKVYSVETDTEAYNTEMGPDGEQHLVRATKWVVDQEGLSRIKLGYACLNCLEPFERPFPERCPLCNYEVAEHQLEDLAGADRGEEHVGPLTTLDEERERMIEENDYRRSAASHSKSSIIIP